MRPCRERCRRAALRTRVVQCGLPCDPPEGVMLSNDITLSLRGLRILRWEDDLVSVRLPSNTVKGTSPSPAPYHYRTNALQVRRLMLCFPKSYYCDHRWHVALSLPTFGVGVLSQFSRPREANTARARRGQRLGSLSDRGIDIAKTPHFALAFRMRCGCFRRRACRLLLRDRCSCK